MRYSYSIRTRPIENCIKVLEDTGNQKYVDWQPGNGTRYALLFVRINIHIDSIIAVNDWQITWLTKQTTMFISEHSFVHVDYVAEKLSANMPDAICIAEAIGYILGFKSTTCEQFDPELPIRLIMDA